MSTGTENRARKPSHIAICGIGCIFPQADNLESYWDNIKRGVNSITDIPKETHWSPEDYLDTDPKTPDKTYAARGGFLSPIDFNPMEYGIAPKDIEATDTTQIFGMIAAREALKDAGYWEGKHFDRSRTSVILGVTSTLELAIPLGARLGHPIWRKALRDSGFDDDASQEVIERISDGYVDWQENSFPGLLGNVAAGRIANRFDLGGHQLCGGRRLRQFPGRTAFGGDGTCLWQGGHGADWRHRYVQRHLHVHVLQQDAGSFAHRRCKAILEERRWNDPG